MKENNHGPLPLDEYLKELKRSGAHGVWPDLDVEKPEMPRDQYADDYIAGAKYVCANCNTAFSSLRRKPVCPFCHQSPTE